MSEWTLLTNHGIVLSFLARNPHITALEVAQAIGIQERATRRIIADLEAAGYITKKREGRGNRYSVDPDLPLRHQTHQHVAVGNLLETLGWDRSKRARSSGLDLKGSSDNLIDEVHSV